MVCYNLLVVAIIACTSIVQSLLTVNLLAYVHAASFWCDEAYYMMLGTLRNCLPSLRVLVVDHDDA